jgi:type I restriction enzyme M protein
MANNHSETERRLWEAADQFRANSELKSSEYAVPVLGLIFLRYADHRFTQAEQELEGKGSGRRKIGKEDYQAKGVMYLPPKARFSYLLKLPDGENIGKAINRNVPLHTWCNLDDRPAFQLGSFYDGFDHHRSVAASACQRC